MPNLPVPSHRTLNAAWTAVLIVLLAGGVILTLFVLDLAQSRDVGRADRADLRQIVETQAVIIDDEQTKRRLLQEQIEELGEEPVVDDAPTLLSPLPAVGRPSFAQVVAAVETSINAALRAVCDGNCRGNQGEAGEAGAPGEPGVTGSTGQTGAQGAQGAQGERGPVGPQGDRGPAGADAPRIVGFSCTGMTPQTITFTLSDGTVYSAECSFLEPIPEPAE